MTATQTSPLTSSTLAVNGGAPLRSASWPAWPVWDESDEAAVLNVIRSGKWFSGSGTQNQEFAERWREAHHAHYAVPCANGTVALELAMRGAGIQAGDEVITSPYTFIATAAAIVQINAVPRFADVDPTTLNLDPLSVEAAITPKTRAIMAVHIAGCPADLDALGRIAAHHDILLLEDAAQAHLSEWKGRRVGAIGRAGTFSFQASKNLNAGEGGIVVTDDEETFERVWSLSNCGRVRNGGWYEHRMLSGNYRLSELQAALLLSQFARLEEQSARRDAAARRLTELLSGIPGITPLTRDPRVTAHSYHLYIFRYRAAEFGGLTREEFIRALNAEGVPCSPGYSPLYRSPAFLVDSSTHPLVDMADYRSLHLPEVELACEEAVWLPQRLLLAEPDEMADVAAAVGKIRDAVAAG